MGSKRISRRTLRSMRGSVYLSIEMLLHHSADESDWVRETADEFHVPVEDVMDVVRSIAGEMGRRGMKMKGRPTP